MTELLENFVFSWCIVSDRIPQVNKLYRLVLFAICSTFLHEGGSREGVTQNYSMLRTSRRYISHSPATRKRKVGVFVYVASIL